MKFSPIQLHIPDGFLSLIVSIIFWLLSILFIGLAIRQTNKNLGEKQIPLMGIMAAFVFAAQMLNFPVAGGTSGHFLGGALVAMVLGPWASILVMTAVIAIQGLLFQDGGLLVMGANIFNMGIITAIIGFGMVRLVANQPSWLRLGVAGLAAWLSTMASALITALQLWISGTTQLSLVLPAMLGVHILIGIGEAVITVAALGVIERTRPELLKPESTRGQGGAVWMIGAIMVILLFVILAPYASQKPDGLEWVAKELGFLSSGISMPINLLPDYSLPILGSTPLSTMVAGLVGIGVVFALVVLISRAIKKKDGA